MKKTAKDKTAGKQNKPAKPPHPELHVAMRQMAQELKKSLNAPPARAAPKLLADLKIRIGQCPFSLPLQSAECEAEEWSWCWRWEDNAAWNDARDTACEDALEAAKKKASEDLDAQMASIECPTACPKPATRPQHTYTITQPPVWRFDGTVTLARYYATAKVIAAATLRCGGT